MPNISVAVVEDHPDLRKSMTLILKSSAGYACAGSYERCEDLLDNLDDIHPEVILMDIQLPGISGIEGVQRVKKVRPETHILMLTMYEDDNNVFQAICAGADGYLLKRSSPVEILQAIQDVAAGGVPMTPSVAQQVIKMFRGSSSPREEMVSLTPREGEILHSLVDGLDYKQISERHFISIDTVRGHIRHIYEKLQVHSKSEAVAKALRQHLA